MTKDQMMSMLVMEASPSETSLFAEAVAYCPVERWVVFLLHRHDALL